MEPVVADGSRLAATKARSGPHGGTRVMRQHDLPASTRRLAAPIVVQRNSGSLETSRDVFRKSELNSLAGEAGVHLDFRLVIPKIRELPAAVDSTFDYGSLILEPSCTRPV